MSDVSRDEFDALVGRVVQLERRHDAAMELIAAELVGLRSHIDGQVDRIVDHVNASERRLGDQLELHGQLLNRIIDQLNPDAGE